jgi:hypothetical protein
MGLLKVSGGISRRFRDFYAYDAAILGVEQGADLIENIPGDVFRRRVLIDRVKNQVQIRMVKLFNDVGKGIFKRTEIDPDPQLVKGGAADKYFDPPVMAMHIFAGAVIVFKMVGRGKMSI